MPVNPGVARAEDVRVKLDTDALLAGIRMSGAPPHEEGWMWDHILMLHDIANHDGACMTQRPCLDHGMNLTEPEFDPECEWCRACFGLGASDG